MSQSHLTPPAPDGDLSYSRSLPSVSSHPITILHSNIRGFISHSTELLGQIELLTTKPSFISLNETLLDASIEDLTLSGYTLVSRKDREDRQGGGIALFCLPEIFDTITHLEDSKFERSWHTLHSDMGPVLLGIWYRPPDNEIESILALQSELDKHRDTHIASIIIGDMNVHHVTWLRFSRETQRQGAELFRIATGNGLTQCVKDPTRYDYLLDLVLTDLESFTSIQVLSSISDHNSVLASFDFRVHWEASISRTIWDFTKADWEAIKSSLSAIDFTWMKDAEPDIILQFLTHTILDLHE